MPGEKIRRKFNKLFLIITVLALLPSCVYLRLLEVKRQLSDFDEYFATKETDSFTLQFKKPVLFREDLDFLTKLQPSQTKDIANGKRTVYILEKVDQEGNVTDPQVDLQFTLDFDNNDRLIRWIYSPLFLSMVPAEFLEISLRSLGNSKVIQSKRQLRADLSQIHGLSTTLPVRQDIESVLGSPLQVIDGEDNQRLLYRFRLVTNKVEEGYEERQFTLVKLDFSPITNKLVKTSGRFIGLKISVDYRKFQRNSG